MKDIVGVEFRNGSKEELLPGVEPDFPYIASRVEIDKLIGRFAPWHWHREVELFYVEKGVLEYYTPKGKTVFPAGSAGIVNSNVIHMTKPEEKAENTTQLLHIFDSVLIGGFQGSRVEQKYITPFIAATQLEILAITPDNPEHGPLLQTIRDSFLLSSKEYAYELKLCQQLTEIWYGILTIAEPLLKENGNYNKANDKLKMMLIYIQEHYPEKMPISKIAEAAFISERDCFRTFQECMHMTPAECVKSYRLQKACDMLAKGQESITMISHSCGLGSSSYFGKVFHEVFGCTPLEYRKKWRDFDI